MARMCNDIMKIQLFMRLRKLCDFKAIFNQIFIYARCSLLYFPQCHLNSPTWQIVNERAVPAYILYNARHELIH